MNCKPGDLAYLCYEVQDSGIIVEVLHGASDLRDGRLGWKVRSKTPVRCTRKVSGKEEHLIEFYVEDCYLRPISGVPVHDQQTSEVTA